MPVENVSTKKYLLNGSSKCERISIKISKTLNNWVFCLFTYFQWKSTFTKTTNYKFWWTKFYFRMDECFKLVQSKRKMAEPNPNFYDQLMNYERNKSNNIT